MHITGILCAILCIKICMKKHMTEWEYVPLVYFMCHLMRYVASKKTGVQVHSVRKSRQELGNKVSLLDGANRHP